MSFDGGDESLIKAMSAAATEQRAVKPDEPSAKERFRASLARELKKLRDDGDAADAAAEIFLNPERPRPSPPRRPQVLRFDGKTMPWGKHIGEPIKDVPITYIAWLMDRQMTGESAVTDALAEKLLESFMLQIMAVPVYKRVMLQLADKAKAGAPPAPRRAIATADDEDAL